MLPTALRASRTLSRLCGTRWVSGAAGLMDLREAGGFRVEDLAILPDFVTAEEEAAILAEVDPLLQQRPYESDHWDGVIDNYRECERAFPNLSPVLARVARQMSVLLRDPGLLLPIVHVIDLAGDGEIRHHVDSVKFSGDHIIALSLLTDAVLLLRRETGGSGLVRALAPRRSVYVMRDSARYEWGHAVLKGPQELAPSLPDGTPMGEPVVVDRGRRVSVIVRDDVPPRRRKH